MKKLLLILLLPILAQADIQRVDEESRLPYWRSYILSGDPNQLNEYIRILIKEIERIQGDLITAVNLGIDIDDTNIRYFGGKDINGDYPEGTWRIIKIDTDNFQLQKLISGTWTQQSKWSTSGGFEYLTTLSDSASEFQIESGTITGAVDITASGIVTADEIVDSSTSGTSTEWEDAYNKRVDTWTAALSFVSNVASLAVTSAFIIVGNGSGIGVAVAMSGDVFIDNAGLTTIQPDSVALGTDTTGDYVESITNGDSITGGDGGSEGAALTLDVADDSIDGTELVDDITVDGTGLTIGDGGTTDYMEISPTGDISIFNQNEIRFYDVDSSNYIGFKAPALTGNQIWLLPIADGDPGAVLETNGLGNLAWADSPSEKAWAFMSRDASSGTNYIGGYYKFETSDNDFNPSVTFGTANVSYAAHFFLVQAAGGSGGTDTVIRVTGTTINDQGTRATAVDVDITVDDAGAAGTYYETTQKWLGQVTIAKQSGPDLLCNYGYCKYWDDNNTNFKVVGIEATWLGAKNDNTPDIKLRHHKPDGWTYNIGAAPTPPAEVASMATDHDTEIFIKVAEEGAWKRDNLSVNIRGGDNEGTIIELTTTTNRTYAIGNFMIRITPFGENTMIYENGDAMIFENGDTMIYN